MQRPLRVSHVLLYDDTNSLRQCSEAVSSAGNCVLGLNGLHSEFHLGQQPGAVLQLILGCTIKAAVQAIYKFDLLAEHSLRPVKRLAPG